MLEEWVYAGGRWLNMAAIVKVVPLPGGCAVHFADGSREWMIGKTAKELISIAVKKESDDGRN